MVVAGACVRLVQPELLNRVLAAASEAGLGLESRASWRAADLGEGGVAIGLLAPSSPGGGPGGAAGEVERELWVGRASSRP